MSVLELQNLSVSLRGRDIFRDVTLSVQKGEMVGLIGPNGAGKTTLMRAALGLVAHGGHSSLAGMAPMARARAVAWMPQSREIAWPVSIEALVRLGLALEAQQACRDVQVQCQAAELQLRFLSFPCLVWYLDPNLDSGPDPEPEPVPDPRVALGVGT